MLTNEQLFSHHYTIYRVSAMVDIDIKNIKRINNIYTKYVRTNNDIYLREIINTFKMISNYIDLKTAKEVILFYIDDELKESIKKIMENI